MQLVFLRKSNNFQKAFFEKNFLHTCINLPHEELTDGDLRWTFQYESNETISDHSKLDIVIYVLTFVNTYPAKQSWTITVKPIHHVYTLSSHSARGA